MNLLLTPDKLSVPLMELDTIQTVAPTLFLRLLSATVVLLSLMRRIILFPRELPIGSLITFLSWFLDCSRLQLPSPLSDLMNMWSKGFSQLLAHFAAQTRSRLKAFLRFKTPSLHSQHPPGQWNFCRPCRPWKYLRWKDFTWHKRVLPRASAMPPTFPLLLQARLLLPLQLRTWLPLVMQQPPPTTILKL